MEIWHIWIITAALLFIAEIFTSGFALACLSIGAVGGAVASVFYTSFTSQLIVFIIVTAVAFVSVRPVILKLFMSGKKDVPTNTDALIGRQAIVAEDILSNTGGRVNIDGDSWKAVSADNQSIIKGSVVKILKVNSVILTVEKL